MGEPPGFTGILGATRELQEAMRVGTDPKAAAEPGRGEPVVLEDGGNPYLGTDPATH